MKVSIFGVGYVGLVQAVVLADVGNNVLCVDVDAAKVAALNAGEVPIFEPGLEALLQKNLDEKRISFTTDAAAGVDYGEFIFIAVGTPPDEDGSADLTHVLNVADKIGRYMTDSKIILDKSTVPVGTATQVRNAIQAQLTSRNLTLNFTVASNPEFLKEGAAVNDCMRPERIIIGIEDTQTTAIAAIRELYEPFSRNHEKVIFMDVKSAELTKYAANCMLATKISFMNEIASLAELLGADIEMVRKGIGSDSRIGYHFIYPGCGYGGSCFPKDVKALINTAQKSDFPLHILKAVEKVNEAQKLKPYQHLLTAFNGDISGKTIALWGLAFKPNTDDMRDAPSRVLLQALWDQGVTVQAFDPEALKEAQRIFGMHPQLRLMGTKEAALQGADALMICTEWQQFRSPDFELIRQTLTHPIIIDGRNLFDPARMASRGFKYFGIGRGESLKHT